VPGCLLSGLELQIVPRRHQVVAFTSMSLRRADVANGSFGVDRIATAISALGRRLPAATPISLPACGRWHWTANQPNPGLAAGGCY